jgi:hypothetical protein
MMRIREKIWIGIRIKVKRERVKRAMKGREDDQSLLFLELR